MDVWPTNLLQPFAVRILDTTSLLMLQLACILEMVESWHKVGALIRVFLCVNRDDDVDTMRKNVKQVNRRRHYVSYYKLNTLNSNQSDRV